MATDWLSDATGGVLKLNNKWVNPDEIRLQASLLSSKYLQESPTITLDEIVKEEARKLRGG